MGGLRRFIAVAGSGFSSSMVARESAEAGYGIELFKSREHIAGNCHTEPGKDTDGMVQKYGTHIFHTGDNVVRGIYKLVLRVFILYQSRESYHRRTRFFCPSICRPSTNLEENV